MRPYVCLFSVCCAGIGSATSSAWASAATIDMVREANLESLNRLKTARVEYILTSDDFRESPSSEASAAIAAAFENQPQQIPAAMKQIQLNQKRHEEVEIQFDAEATGWKTSFRDLRNLDELIAREQLPPTKRASLDRSRVVLTGGGLSALLIASTNSLFIGKGPDPRGGSGILASPLQLGVFSDTLFEDAARYSLAACSSSGRDLLCWTLEFSSGVKRILKLDPEIAYRCREDDTYSPTGQLLIAMRLRDYRVVDEVHFPFEYERRKYDSGGRLVKHEKIVVTAAKLNQQLPPNALRLHLTSRTHVYAHDWQAEFAVPAGQLLGVNDLRPLLEAHSLRAITTRPSQN